MFYTWKSIIFSVNKLYCLIIVFLIFRMGSAQNLIPNGDFEKHVGCPDNLGQLDSCLFWINPANSPNYGSPDYFNHCSLNSISSVPLNIDGFQQAHSGNAYSGIILGVDNPSLPNYREYLEVPLTSSLQSNTCYHFAMYVNLANMSRFTSNEIGVYFSNTIVSGINNFLPLPFTPQIRNVSVINPDTLNWTLIEGDLTASGGESYLIIGNFRNDSSTTKTLVNHTIRRKLIYIYIDDVSLIKCDGIVTTPEIGKVFILRNISFETNKSELLLKSIVELDSLVRYLMINPNTIINIAGFTDNKGSLEHNLQLSFLRAKAVANYLISRGVNESRVTYKGYGSSNPIQSNESENGRHQNRRVEFTIKNK